MGTHAQSERKSILTDIAEVTSAAPVDGAGARRRKGSGLDAMVLPELKQLAGSLGLKGTGAMRKGQLIEAIQSAQGGSTSHAAGAGNGERRSARRAEAPAEQPSRSNGAPADVAAALDDLQRAPREEIARVEEGSRSEPAQQARQHGTDQGTGEAPAQNGESGDNGQGDRRSRRRDQGRDSAQQNGEQTARNGDQRNDQSRNDQNRERSEPQRPEPE